jgi:hypothetical protein
MGQRHGRKTLSVLLERLLLGTGLRYRIPVRQHLQPAKQALKLAKKVVSKTKVAAKHTLAKALAQIPMVNLFLAHGN